MADYDMILPEGFDPDLGDQNFDEDGVLVDAPVTETPTTAEPLTESEPVEQTGTQEPTTVPEVQQPAGLKVRFNHEERELSYDEAVAYAQKGMNYDKLEERIRGYEALHSKMSRLAKDLEYESPEEMIEAAAQNLYERQVRELMDRGNTEDMARFLVNERMKEASAAGQDMPTSQAPSAVPPRPVLSDERRAELDEFVRAYPGVVKLPDEVIAANRNGTRLLVAYERYKNKAAQNELAILKQNQAAAAKAPVTGTVGKAATGGKSDADDPFLVGFNKGI